jgi:hypothetical protein
MNAEAIGGERIAVEDESCDWRLRCSSFGVERGDNVCFLCLRGGFFFLLALQDAFEELSNGALVFDGVADFGGWSEEAEFGIGGDLFHGLRCGFGGGWLFGKVEAGDLQAVEEEAGAARVDVVGGDALKDLADGVLDGGAIFGEREFEGGAAGAAGVRVSDGPAGGVVVVAEVFAAEAWAAAAVAVGEDVAALVAFGCFGWCFDGGVHWSLPTG